MKLTLLLTMAMAIGGVACRATPPPATDKATAVVVAVGTAETSDLAARFEAGGVVRANVSAVIASRVMATIATVHVRPGDRVRRGSPLVRLDSREVRAHAASAAAALDQAVEAARAAEADRHSAEAAARLARVNFERISALAHRQSATAHELDQAAAGLAVADAQLQGARARIAAAHATREAARQAVSAADVGVSYTTLTAPFDGVITERHSDPGSMAVPGTTLLILEDVSQFRIEVELDDGRAATVSVGQAVEVRLDTASGVAWAPSTVVEVARANAASHSFIIKADVTGHGALRAGMFGRVRFTGAPRKTLTVASSAVFRRGQLAFVYAVDPESLARLRSVAVGDAAGDRLEVLAGLRSGDRVVIDPPLSLGDGVLVSERAGTRAVAGQP